MRIVFLADPIEQFKAYKDSTVVMIESAWARGHEAYALEAEGIRLDWSDQTRSSLRVRQLLPPGQAAEAEADSRLGWADVLPSADCDATGFDGLVMRLDPPFDQRFLTCTLQLSALERLGLPVFNAPSALRDHGEKLAVLEFPDLAPPGIVSSRLDDLRHFARQQPGKTVFKPLDGMGGMGIFVVDAQDPNIPSILEMLTQQGQQPIMAQAHLPAIAEGDKRILVFHGEPQEVCLARIPPTGASRGNLAAGGRAQAQPLSPRDREIAERVGAALAPRGLLLLGLDVIGDCLTEINVTSPTGFREIQNQTGLAVGGRFIATLEAAIDRHRADSGARLS